MKRQRGIFEIYLAAAVLVVAAIAVILWQRLEAVAKERDQARAELVAQKANEKVVTKYVDRIVEIQKRVPVVAGNLERLCRDRILPGAGDPHAGAAADAGAGSALDAVAGDVAACQANAEQLRSLQEVLRPQLGQ